jgi:4-oxalomesaconate tautomerase
MALPQSNTAQMAQLVALRSMLFRGGTSKGPMFERDALPPDAAQRNALLLAAMGSPDPRQIDGVGGAHPLTSKAGIVGKGTREGIDLEFLFVQLQPASDQVDITANCGNMLAAVVPFALESGLVPPQGDTTTLRVLTLNTGMVSLITVCTPLGPRGRYVEYEGQARIDGVPGRASPVTIEFLDTAGSVCPSLLPTGSVIDHLWVKPLEGQPGFAPFDIDVSCIDNGMPLVLIDAAALGKTGRESVETLNADTLLKAKLEAIRIAIAPSMGLGDVSKKPYPKMTLLSKAAQGGTIATRSFIPHVCHDAIGVLAAVTVATACKIPGTVAASMSASCEALGEQDISVEHPSGEFTVRLRLNPTASNPVLGAALLRTARLLMRGEIMVPSPCLT